MNIDLPIKYIDIMKLPKEERNEPVRKVLLELLREPTDISFVLDIAKLLLDTTQIKEV